MGILKGKDLYNQNKKLIKNQLKEESDYSDITENSPKVTHAPVKKLSKNISKSGKFITINQINPVNHPFVKPQEVVVEDLSVTRKNEIKSLTQELKELREFELKKIETEKRRILDDAYNEGFEQGISDAQAEYRDKSEEVIHTLDSAVSAKQEYLKTNQDDVIRLALIMSEKLIQHPLNLDESICINILEESLKFITDRNKVIIKLNPIDAAVINSNKEALNAYFKEIKELHIKSDEKIKQGGCFIETHLGYVDSTIETKLSILESLLLTDPNKENDLN